MVFKFYYADNYAIDNNSAVGFFWVGFVFLFGNKGVVGRGIERVTENIYK